MALAEFSMLKCYGSGLPLTETDCSKHPNFVSVNSHETNPAAAPVAVPLISGQHNYSFECYLRWKCTVAPDNQCDNFKVWGGPLQPDSPDNKTRVHWGATETAAVPVDTQSSVAVTTQHDNYYESGQALSLTVEPGDDIIDAINEETWFLVAQIEVDYGAGKGNLTTQVYHLEWDES